MRAFTLGLAFSIMAAVPAFAEDDPMEFQRCIWRCLANANGADDPAYQACITNICEGKGAADAQQSSQTPLAQGRWSYGRHPVLGLSAHVNLDGEAIGFACIEGDGGATLSHRMTKGAVPEPTRENAAGVVEVFLGPFELGGGSTFSDNPEGYAEKKSDFCISALPQYQRARSVLFIDTDYMALQFDDETNTNTMTVNQEGERVSIASEADLSKITKSKTVPLAGSSAAIRKMINACPALKREVSEGCDAW